MKKFMPKNLNIKGAILDKDRLCNYLEKLASEQITKTYSDEKTYPVPILKENFDIISRTYLLLNEHLKLKIDIDQAGEWILDNFYIIEEVTKLIEKELNIKKYRNLTGISNGRYKGFARIYVITAEIMAYTDGKIDEEGLKSYINAYQNKKFLTMEEIWSLPLFLQIVAIQNVRDICDKIYISQIQKYKVESIIERLVEHKERTSQSFNKQVNYIKRENESMNYTFIEYLSYKLKSYGKRGTPYLNILEEQTFKMGTSVGEVIKQVHFSQATNKVSMGNLITSIKDISRMDFVDISKQIGGIEDVLLQDPAGIYGKMDYNTKSDYLNEIREISLKENISEIYIAKTLLKIASEEKEKLEKNNEKEVSAKRMHIGYYLFEDLNYLYKKLDLRKKEIDKEKKSKLYIATNILLPIYICLVFFAFFYLKSSKFFLSFVSALLIYLPLTEIITNVLIYILGKTVKPKRIPKLDFSGGIPSEISTFVVIPTILNNTKKVEELMKKLEVYYLANKSDNIYFAVLGDVTSGKSAEEAFDKDIISSGKAQIEYLNNKYPVLDGLNRFHFLYRKRSWNSKESCYLGWERKRGLLIQFNEFLLSPSTDSFRYNSLTQQLNNIPNIKYIITLDSDTNLVLNSGLELIGAMEHVLNTPIVEKGKVIEGHALIQPRIGVDLNSSSSSLFSKIFSIPRRHRFIYKCYFRRLSRQF